MQQLLVQRVYSRVVFNSGNELEVVRTRTSYRVSRVKSGQNPDIRTARKQVCDPTLMSNLHYDDFPR